MTDKRNKSRKKRFLDVDIWQSTFGEVSVKAIYDIYAQKIRSKEIIPPTRNGMELAYTFSNCVRLLRKLKDPEYELDLEFRNKM